MTGSLYFPSNFGSKGRFLLLPERSKSKMSLLGENDGEILTSTFLERGRLILGGRVWPILRLADDVKVSRVSQFLESTLVLTQDRLS